MGKKKSYNVAVVGALGVVGTEMIATLERLKFPLNRLLPLDIAAHAGKTVRLNGVDYTTEEAKSENFADVDIALFSAGGEASKELAPQAAKAGAIVIDNSSQWRMHADTPLVVPEVNPDDLAKHNGIIANPNCSTIQMVVALKPLHDAARIKRVVVSTYQAVSGAGAKGINSLKNEAADYLSNGRKLPPGGFQHQIAFNCIPHIDVFMADDYTKEERKMIDETCKILGDDSVKVTVTCVRVPVWYGHSEAINIETEQPLSAKEARRLLNEAPGIIVKDNPANNDYPMPLIDEQEDEVVVGRIRADNSIANGINLWVTANNVRKGAALNAVQIAQRLVADNLV